MEFISILPLLIGLFTLISMWITVNKAGHPGWSQIIPIWNIIVLLQVGGKPTWWVVLILLVPIANLIFLIMMLNAVAKSFGKNEGFTVGLIFLPFIFWPILAFSNAKYQGPIGKQ